ncbi:MAG TPA: DUF6582 domain-containing protein [Acidisarcina sp.]
MPTAKKTKTSSQETKGTLSTGKRNQMKDSTYAFPKQRKEPLNDASHVRNAIARFDQVKDVSDTEREEAFHHIKTAAKKFDVEMTETNWKQLGKKPHTENTTRK